MTEVFENSASFASDLDSKDELQSFRREFSIPQKNGKSVLYFTGNSLGLQPVRARKLVEEELAKWAQYGVDGHFEGGRPWFTYHEHAKKGLSVLVGARESEVVAMNNLTSNLHLMMVSFFRPTKSRFKIIMEAGAFPSDQYAVESQLKFHGLDPEQALIEISPREGEFTLRNKDILQVIEEHGNETALVLMSGIQYYTGQKFNIKAITEMAHQKGAVAGFDLAHAIGNIKMNLHDDQVDFAVWCSYKYLNSGPGGVSGVFVHERHGDNPGLPRFAGWWGHDQDSRFLMQKGFKPMPGADGWQLSNVNILGTAAHLAALNIVLDAGWQKLLDKSRNLTAYLQYLLADLGKTFNDFKVITPEKPDERGCQLSLFFYRNGREVFDFLTENGVVADWREHPLNETSERAGVIRIAPVPLYNTYQDVFQFSRLLKLALEKEHERITE
ncbi:kynureninase [Fulvivirga sedimenti]|uniref:Kynureninase n=1 Tax=Fulvivirga sedimenti TaxID=2879465 RepID=A0A9X1HVJ4_9BACT|nr:kynureninase [Fulvivirga sedimenti]MCA6078145.1 kynureninase [Fulvivirga sedimenti]